MKKVSTSLLKSINWLLGGILALLGFSACNRIEYDMYGCPHSNYTIKGQVTNETNIPIPGIRICSPYGEDIPYADTLYTNNKGEFSYTFDGFSRRNEIPLLLTDIDGEENGGNFAPDSVSVSFKGAELTGGDGSWYLGEATKEVTIVLKKKKEENNK
ncbi:radical SAM-associated putative lipoprotein [Parabacteroides acidifaciens]|uniref:Radical SAM-associated putative lipoprotein n=1 Tax=Parabacteroides acidifaciens TaxID=2290935 RepID=A0A3D8HA92_9BACT|nr:MULTISPECIES: radical SAM-associated putative lipoprotein [Parabacteroides]MBC8603356.1 radical SAM-associated putative lipoprotein [Parabacteroides acidifaciens]RDU47909.1 hypothetical protein DWU89_17110 [Parabacteroides acidifaciens]RHR58882.1 hypothetical protein DWW90_10365 [Parabacteroides sp. AF17-28]